MKSIIKFYYLSSNTYASKDYEALSAWTFEMDNFYFATALICPEGCSIYVAA